MVTPKTAGVKKLPGIFYADNPEYTINQTWHHRTLLDNTGRSKDASFQVLSCSPEEFFERQREERRRRDDSPINIAGAYKLLQAIATPETSQRRYSPAK